jgi:uncharacterized protein HemX
MSSEEILIAGKALIWFAIPLGLALWEWVRVRRSLRADRALRQESRSE